MKVLLILCIYYLSVFSGEPLIDIYKTGNPRMDKFNRLSMECGNSTDKRNPDNNACLKLIKFQKEKYYIDDYTLSSSYTNLSIVYKKQKIFWKENNALKKALSLNPYSYYALYRMGMKYYKAEGVKHNYLKAVKYLKEALYNSSSSTDTGKIQNILDKICKQHSWACN